MNASDRFGRVPLIEPCNHRLTNVVTALLDYGADPDHSGHETVTARMMCRLWPQMLRKFSYASNGRRPGKIPLRGQVVRLTGLSRADLNGQIGLCGMFNTKSERYKVSVKIVGDQKGEHVKKVLAIRSKNLEVVSNLRCIVCGARFRQGPLRKTLLKCVRCKDPAYRVCSRECQKAGQCLD